MAGISVVYRCSEAGGGILAMKDGFATTYMLAPASYKEVQDDLVNNFDRHLELSSSIDSSVTVVTGCTMTGDYHAALITACERSMSFSSEVGLEPFVMSKLGVSLLHARSQKVLQNSGHRHRDNTIDCDALNCESNKNQCVFLNLLQARRRRFRGLKLQASAEPRDLGGDQGTNHSNGEVDSLSASSSAGDLSGGIELTDEYGNENHVSCEDI
jgi:hypothetical protein